MKVFVLLYHEPYEEGVDPRIEGVFSDENRAWETVRHPYHPSEFSLEEHEIDA